MARKLIPVSPVNRYNLTLDQTPVSGDTTNGMYLPNDGATYIQMVSTSGSSATVTVTIPAGYDLNLTAGPRTYTLPANGKARTGFFPISRYGVQLLIGVSSALVSFSAYTQAA